MNLDQYNTLNSLLSDLDWIINPRNLIAFKAEDKLNDVREKLKQIHKFWSKIDKSNLENVQLSSNKQ